MRSGIIRACRERLGGLSHYVVFGQYAAASSRCWTPPHHHTKFRVIRDSRRSSVGRRSKSKRRTGAPALPS